MSPLWRDEVGLFLGPSKVVMARMKRGLRPACVAEHGETLDVADSADWSAAIAALNAQLEQTLWQNANVRVVVSDHWTRYAVLPWSRELTGSAERMTHARLILNNTYGDIADDWSISLSDAAPGKSTIICAVPGQLIIDLETVFSAGKLKLISLQPQLLVSFNGWREQIPASAAWFASIDEGCLAALHVSDGACDRVRSVRISGDWAVEVRRMQTMGRLASNRPAEGPVFVDAPSWLRESANSPVSKLSDTGTEQKPSALTWLDTEREPENIADKVTLLKGMYA